MPFEPSPLNNFIFRVQSIVFSLFLPERKMFFTWFIWGFFFCSIWGKAKYKQILYQYFENVPNAERNGDKRRHLSKNSRTSCIDPNKSSTELNRLIRHSNLIRFISIEASSVDELLKKIYLKRFHSIACDTPIPSAIQWKCLFLELVVITKSRRNLSHETRKQRRFGNTTFRNYFRSNYCKIRAKNTKFRHRRRRTNDNNKQQQH